LKFKFEYKDAKHWSRLGPRAMFGQFMLDLAKLNNNLIVLSADLGRSSGLDRFKTQYPDQYLSVGISEQNMVGVASGLAKEGHKVFITSFAPFLSMRASEQIRMNLGYMELDVNLIALGSGLSMGFLGNSHYGLEDISFMRSIPNINISSPADCSELGKILYDYTFSNRGPSYTRLTGIPGSPYVYYEDYNYKFGEPVTISEGKEILILSTGSLVAQCKLALDNLYEYGIKPELINVHTLKPLDQVLTKIFLPNKFRHVFVVEEHSIIGGLTSIVSEWIALNQFSINLMPITLPDAFGKTGTYDYLLDLYGLNSEKISKKIKEIL